MSELFKSPATQPPDAKPAGEKRARGAYYTPDKLAMAICNTLVHECGIGAVNSILEPGCGGGAFLRAADYHWPNSGLCGVDLLPACEGPGRVEKQDLFTVEPSWTLIVGNPDFGIAEKVVRHCISILAPGGHLALLLRLAFLGGGARVALYKDFPLRYLQPIAQRPSFTGGGSDPMEYGLFVWREGFTACGEILPPLVWR